MRASLVIPTRNRLEELRQALVAAYRQTVPLEVVVMDDGASDETGAMVRRDFPAVRYYRLASDQGPSFQRNRGLELASNPIVFPLDDDSILVSPETVAQTLEEFAPARVGAVAIPYRNVRLDQQVHQRAPSARGVFATAAFVGAAHAVRRDLFLRLGGYREHLFYMGEEGDYCARLLAAGYVTRLGCADPIHHLESPRRNLARADYYGRRNDVLFAWHNVPWPAVLGYWLATTLNGLWFGCRVGRPVRMAGGLLGGYRDCARYWRLRRPLPARTCRLFRRLKRQGSLPLETIASELPPLPAAELAGTTSVPAEDRADAPAASRPLPNRL